MPDAPNSKKRERERLLRRLYNIFVKIKPTLQTKSIVILDEFDPIRRKY